MDEKEIQDVMTLAQQTLHNDPTGYNYFHVKRVAHLAIKFYHQDISNWNLNDEKVIITMGYLHDVIDEKIVDDILTKISQIKHLSFLL